MRFERKPHKAFDAFERSTGGHYALGLLETGEDEYEVRFMAADERGNLWTLKQWLRKTRDEAYNIKKATKEALAKRKERIYTEPRRGHETEEKIIERLLPE